MAVESGYQTIISQIHRLNPVGRELLSALGAHSLLEDGDWGIVREVIGEANGREPSELELLKLGYNPDALLEEADHCAATADASGLYVVRRVVRQSVVPSVELEVSYRLGEQYR